jgi:tripartite-type tricarboxylate transporter receptor subunit TctC
VECRNLGRPFPPPQAAANFWHGASVRLLCRGPPGRRAITRRGTFNFIIPYAPGGGFDSYVRFISPVMEHALPRAVSIVPMNVTAGSGARGITQLYRSKPDGYTIGIFDVPGMFIQQAVQGNGAYDLSKFAWIGCMGEGERYLIGVGANSPLKDIRRSAGPVGKACRQISPAPVLKAPRPPRRLSAPRCSGSGAN